MKAWRLHQFGEPEQMEFGEVPIPEPGPGQVCIRHTAASVNFFDLLQIHGKYQVKPPLPFIPGSEACGVVDAVGESVNHLKMGDRVMAILFGGAFAEYSLAPADRTFSVPPAMSDAEAAALPIVYHTSLFALGPRGQLKSGETLLVHAGASGTGMAAIQIGKAMGARVIATAGSPEKLEFCRHVGAEAAFSYQDASWVTQVRDWTGGVGADVIYDPVGGEVFDLSTKCIAPEGRLLVVGFASGRIPAIAANRILLKDISVVGVLWGPYADRNPGHLPVAHQDLMRMYGLGQIRPVIWKSFPLSDALSALRSVAGRTIAGKIVLLPD
jgi:NADPH2:quinone reductase